jgi:thioester reductase-like protein
MSERKVFVTGATGFIGSHLTHRLLSGGRHVIALARGSKALSAEARVQEVLNNVGPADLTRLEVLEGDIAQPNFGFSEEVLRKVVDATGEIWHCAASLSFAEEDRDEIFRMNVGGMKNVLAVAEQIPTRRLHHISTAYIAGNRTGLALETEIDVGQTFKNPYEESKCQAEVLIAGAHRRGLVSASVYRPSIVIGDSKSGRVTHFHGVYAFIRGLWTALERLRRRMPEGGLINLPLRVLGDETTTLNFVPIDYVIDGMAVISKQPSSAGETYHLANPQATENRVWLPHICRALGVEGIQLVCQSSFLHTPMTKLEVLFQKQMSFYYQYLQGEPRFDCRRAQEALKDAGIECPRVTVEFIQKMAGWYVDFLNSARQETSSAPDAAQHV